MKTLLQRWRGLQIAAAIAALTLAGHGAPEVQTLGGGPNQAGPGRAGANNGDTFSVAKFNDPVAVAIDSNGNLYIADRANNKVRKVTNPGEGDSLTSTFASRLPAPTGVAVDASNRVYVVTKGDGKLRVYNSTGSLLRTATGLQKPTGIALDGAGNAYVVELVGNVKLVAPDNSVTLIASGFLKPQGIALLASGLLAVSDTGHHAIYTVNPADGTTTLVAGNNGDGFMDGAASTAQFKMPTGLGAAPNGALVIADRGNHRVRVLSASNEVTTLYGVPRSQWVGPFPGWVDGTGGPDGVAAARDPVGVAVANNGTVYTTEIYWNILRQVTDTGLGGSPFGTNSTGISTNDVQVGTNVVRVVGTNIISFGFESGEVSSDFIGAAGQHFYAPVTLTVAPGQKVYSFQLSLSATGETGVALNPLDSGFASMLMKPVENNVYTPIIPNYTFLNASINLRGVGWLERFQQTNLYNTLAQDLISFSIAKDTLFNSSGGKSVLGAYRMVIPSTAVETDTFRIAIVNPSGTSDGVSQPVPLRVPTDGSLGAGALNTIKRVTLASRQYVVGDSAPFRWFNAGDFGNDTLANNDVIEVFQSARYFLNTPMPDSDLFDAMDASDGSSATVSFGDDVSINSITNGDGVLAVDDVWVTFRRSLDPTLKWYARYWSNGVRQVVEVPNTLSTGSGDSAAVASPYKRLSPAKVLEVRPSAALSVPDSMPAAGETIQLPIRINVTEGYSVRVMMLNLTVEALDGSPVVTAPIHLQFTPVFRDPQLADSRGPNNFAAAWLNETNSGIAGDSLLAYLTVQVPANAGAGAAYRVHFDHFSASPNGAALFDVNTSNALILLSDRSASTWEDGIADAWRLRYFGSISAPESAPGADADADGVINSEEYVNDTDPTNPLSH